MSLHICIVCFQKISLSECDNVLQFFGNTDTSSQILSSYDSALHMASTEWKENYKIVFSHNDWLVVLDPFMLMFHSQLECKNVSHILRTNVLAMFCEGTSNSYGLTLYENGDKRFSYLTDDTQLLEVNYDVQNQLLLPEQINEVNTLKITDFLGIDCLKFSDVNYFLLKKLILGRVEARANQV